MKPIKNFIFFFFIGLLIIVFTISYSGSEKEYVLVSPVSVNLSNVTCAKLTDYHFFIGDMKQQKPSLDVLPYEPGSPLFEDYAHKKRFIRMLKGTKARYDAHGKILNLPIGIELVKTLYYDKVQNVAATVATRIIETRIMIRKSKGWIFADYVWNAKQTEAFLNLNESNISLDFKDKNNILHNVPCYRIPHEVQCVIVTNRNK